MARSLTSLWSRGTQDDCVPVQAAPRLFLIAHGARAHHRNQQHMSHSADEDRAGWQRWVHDGIPSPTYKRRLTTAAAWLHRRFQPDQILLVNVGPPWPHDLAALFGCGHSTPSSIVVDICDKIQYTRTGSRCALLLWLTGRLLQAPPSSHSMPSSTSALPCIAGLLSSCTTLPSCTRRPAAAQHGTLLGCCWLPTFCSRGGTMRLLRCTGCTKPPAAVRCRIWHLHATLRPVPAPTGGGGWGGSKSSATEFWAQAGPTSTSVFGLLGPGQRRYVGHIAQVCAHHQHAIRVAICVSDKSSNYPTRAAMTSTHWAP